VATWESEPLIAVRGRRRWVPRYQPLPEPVTEPDPGGPPGLATDAAEAALARVLAAACPGQHVLVTRRGFGERWDRYVRQPLQRAGAPHEEPPAPSHRE